METKLITFASVSEEVNRLRYLLYEIPNQENPISPIFIHCDGIAIIGRVRNHYYNG